MENELVTLFEQIDLNWCDNPGKEIQITENYARLLAIFPNLQELNQEWINSDNFEFNRTMRHIFRCLKIYYLLKEGKLTYDSLSHECHERLRDKIQRFTAQNELLLPILLMYHDIGRFVDRAAHTYHSADLIVKRGLLDCFKLSEMEKLVLRKTIEYHLLLATIYTGESTFFGILSLLNDNEFIQILAPKNKKYISFFTDFLEIFTYIDVLGYPYSKIFDHYLTYYEAINNTLKTILRLWPNREKIISEAKTYSLQWNDWRLAGALRIFQFINTEPHLTEEFYFTALKESIRSECEDRGVNFDWDSIKSTYLSNIYKFQVKYALPLLMLLAFGEFKRAQIEKKVSANLLKFWISLSTEINNRELNAECVWNIYFEKMPFWSDITQGFIEKLEIDKLKSIIKAATVKFDDKRKEYDLFLDFSNLLE
jgi:hypothetical protein